MNSDIIKKSIEIEDTPESVFSAISNENELTKWWVDVPKLEKKIDGIMNFRFLKENSELLKNDYIVQGNVLEIIPNQKLSYTWRPVDDQDYPSTVVTWTIEPTEKKSKVTVLHSGLANVKDYSRLEEGWEYFIKKLGKFLDSKT